MTFNRNKIRRATCNYPGAKAYIYKNYSIMYSLEKTADGAPARAVSIVSHGIPNIPPTGSDIAGILDYFQFDIKRPVTHFKIRHPGEFGMGDSLYYMQAIGMNPCTAV